MLFLSHGITAEKTITLKLANQFAPEHYMSLLFDRPGQGFGKRTNGRVKVINFHAATLALLHKHMMRLREHFRSC